MRRFLLLACLLLTGAEVLAQAQGVIRYTPSGVAGGGSFVAPLLAPAANNCTAIPYSFTSDTNTGTCTSAADTLNLYTAGSSRLAINSTALTSTVPILLPNGSAAAPSLSFTNQSTAGLYWTGSANELGIATGGVGWYILSQGSFRSLASSGYFSMNDDIYLTRDGAANWQVGLDSATATAQTISAADSTGAGIAGASLTLSGGAGGTFAPQGAVVSHASNDFVARNNAVSLTADAVVQYGSTVRPDASADGRFDITGSSETLSIGVLGGVGDSAQGTAYPVIMQGLAYVAPAEDQAVTRAHYLLQSSTAGRVTDSATVSTDGLNIALALYSEAVTFTINPAGCTGGAGCINTALNTPNAGPAGQITLAADAAAAGWVVGQPVIYYNSGGTTPTGLADGQVYFLASVSTTNATLSLTHGGAVVVPSSQGDDATQYLQRLPLAVVDIR